MHMNIIESRPRCQMWAMAVTLGALAAGCNSQDPLLGAKGIAILVPVVTAVTPAPGATGVSTTNPQITATLNVPVAPITGTASMTVTCVTPCVNPTGVVTLDATHTIATFTLTSGTALARSTVYTATVTGATSLAGGIAMAAHYTWQFTTSADVTVPLLSAAPFGTFGGSAGMTNSGILTVVNGDIGTTAVSTSVTGFHDSGAGCTYTEVLGSDVGAVTGTIDTAPPPPTVSCPGEGTAATFAIATQALADARTAYNALVAMAGGPDPGAGNLANKVLVAGVYTAAAGSFMIQGGALTLDAGTDANAVS